MLKHNRPPTWFQSQSRFENRPYTRAVSSRIASVERGTVSLPNLYNAAENISSYQIRIVLFGRCGFPLSRLRLWRQRLINCALATATPAGVHGVSNVLRAHVCVCLTLLPSQVRKGFFTSASSCSGARMQHCDRPRWSRNLSSSTRPPSLRPETSLIPQTDRIQYPRQARAAQSRERVRAVSR